MRYPNQWHHDVTVMRCPFVRLYRHQNALLTLPNTPSNFCLGWIFKKALERDAKFNDAGKDEDVAPVFNVGDVMDAPLTASNAPN